MSLLALIAASAIAGTPAAVPPGEKPVDPYVQSNDNAGAKPVSGTAIFEAFHGREGVQRIADAFVDRNVSDPRVKEIFATADIPRLKRTIAEQFCYLLNGGCAYTGRDMRASHKGMGVQTGDFNAIVENLQASMDAERVPFRAQNVLLGKLAPMEHGVVERKGPEPLKKLARRLDSLRRGD